jgi:ferritin-like protein
MGMNWLQLSELKARFDRAVKSHQETIEVYEEISHLSRGQDPVVHESCRRIISDREADASDHDQELP